MHFICDVKSGKIALNKEADIIKYFTFTEIPQNTIPRQVERIKDFFDFPHKFYMKTQIGKSTKQLIKEGLLPSL